MEETATPIRDVAKEVIKDLSQKRLSKEKRVKEAWQKAVAKRFLLHTQVVSFGRKRLLVNVDSSSWLYELTMRKKKITAKLKEMLKGDFNELQFRIGKIGEKDNGKEG